MRTTHSGLINYAYDEGDDAADVGDDVTVTMTSIVELVAGEQVIQVVPS
jgi:hypothetical protein